jgi:DNA-binding CsgD family transcriptional regulator
MTKLTEFVIEYQKTKSEQIFNQIYSLLKKTKRLDKDEYYDMLKDRATYIFYEQTFKKGNYEFRLIDTKQVELDDVLGELNLELLRIINNYTVGQPFENYLNNSLRLWTPKFINSDFLKNLRTQSIYRVGEGGEEENLADKIPSSNPINIEFSRPLTKKESIVWNVLKETPDLSQDKIAKKLSISQMSVSRAIASIKDKIQK